MMSEGRHEAQPDQPLSPIPLPDELADFLREQGPFACLTHETDRGTAFVIKAPRAEMHSLQGTVPIEVRHALYYHPASPVIRTILVIYDDPTCPLALETFFNVGDPRQRDDFAALADQDELLLLFYDELLTHRLSKRVRHAARGRIEGICQLAETFRLSIPEEHRNFDLAKADVIAQTNL